MSCRRHEEHLESDEIPREENAGNPQFKRARLEAPLEDEQEKTGKDVTERIGPENILMTKSQGTPNSSTHVRKKMCPCTKKRNVGIAWIRQNSFTCKSRQDSSAGSQRKTFALKICVSKLKKLVCWIRPVMKAKARLVIQGQHGPNNAQGLERTGTGQPSAYSFNWSPQ